MPIAQAFAGPAGAGREPGQFTREGAEGEEFEQVVVGVTEVDRRPAFPVGGRAWHRTVHDRDVGRLEQGQDLGDRAVEPEAEVGRPGGGRRRVRCRRGRGRVHAQPGRTDLQERHREGSRLPEVPVERFGAEHPLVPGHRRVDIRDRDRDVVEPLDRHARIVTQPLDVRVF